MKEIKEHDIEFDKRMKLLEPRKDDPLEEYKLSLLETRISRSGKPINSPTSFSPRQPNLRVGTHEKSNMNILEVEASRHQEKMNFLSDVDSANVVGNEREN